VEIVTINFYAPLRRGDDAGDAAKRGGFPRAVRADKAHHFAGVDGETQFADRGDVAVEFCEAFDRDHVAGIVPVKPVRRQA